MFSANDNAFQGSNTVKHEVFDVSSGTVGEAFSGIFIFGKANRGTDGNAMEVVLSIVVHPRGLGSCERSEGYHSSRAVYPSTCDEGLYEVNSVFWEAGVQLCAVVSRNVVLM